MQSMVYEAAILSALCKLLNAPCKDSKMKPTYILAPNCDIPAEGILALGSILVDPKDPVDVILNETEEVPIAAGEVFTNEKLDWCLSHQELLERRFGIWSTFLASVLGIGADVGANFHRNDEERYRCKVLETSFFRPDIKYIAKSMAHPAVKDYTDEWRHKSVYMVTGLKIARGASMETTRAREVGGELRLGIDGTPAGIPVGGGPQIAGKKAKSLNVKFGACDDFIIGYQVIKITAKKDDGFKYRPANKFALMDGEISAELSEDWDIDELDDSDEALEGMQLAITKSEEGRECNVFLRALN